VNFCSEMEEGKEARKKNDHLLFSLWPTHKTAENISHLLIYKASLCCCFSVQGHMHKERKERKKEQEEKATNSQNETIIQKLNHQPLPNSTFIFKTL